MRRRCEENFLYSLSLKGKSINFLHFAVTLSQRMYISDWNIEASVSLLLLNTTLFVCDFVHLHRSGENDVDFIGNLETEEGELPDDLAGATGIFHKLV